MTIPLSLYIHFPWCVKKCPYCDFNSFKKDQFFDEGLYIEALIQDFHEDYARFGQGRKIHTVFMGGGTPSLFSAAALARLFDQLHPYFSSPEIEITLEANPGTIERGQFKDYFALGINRISLGVQSFDAKQLKTLGRIHSSQDVDAAVNELLQAGFKNFNLDLMHGLPNQSTAEAMQDLNLALSFGATHLSWYQLTLEPNTYFARFPPSLPPEDTLLAIEDQGLELLALHGFQRYEISAFTRKNHACAHNLNYWQFGDYLGIGAGAHGKSTDAETKTIWRTSKYKTPKAYLDQTSPFLAEVKAIQPNEHTIEFMLNALRLTDGFDLDLLRRRTLVEPETLQHKFIEAKALGLLEIEPQCLRPSAQGLRFLNNLIMLFDNPG